MGLFISIFFPLLHFPIRLFILTFTSDGVAHLLVRLRVVLTAYISVVVVAVVAVVISNCG